MKNQDSARVFLLICLIALGTLPLSGQTQTGTPSLGSFASFGPSVVNLATLNTQICVPLVNKAGRGQKVSIGLCYNSSIWFPATDGNGAKSWQPVQTFGWNVTALPGIGWADVLPTSEQCGNNFVPVTFYNDYRDGANVVHPVNLKVGGCSQSTGGTVQTTDGSGLTIVVDSSGIKVFPRGGGVIKPGFLTNSQGSYTDPNGNVFTTDSSSIPSFTDTLGMPVLKLTSASPTTTSGATDTYAYLDTAGKQQTISIHWSNFTVQTNFGVPGIAEYSPLKIPQITSVTYPDNTSYQFTYETTPGLTPDHVTGRIASVQVPTGAVVTFAYTGGNNGIFGSDGSTAGLTITTSDGVWQYDRTQNGTLGTTTATDPQKNQTVYSFSNFLQVQAIAYNGAASAGNVLNSVTTCYNSNTTNCPTASVSFPITQTFVTTALENHQQSAEATFYNSVGLTTEIDDYDYGAGAPGALLRQSLITYAPLGNNILDRPQVVQVLDGNGKKIGETDYEYDTTTLVGTSNVPEHVAVTGSRGNVAAKKDWLNTTSSFLTTTYNYFDTGTVQSMTDPAGHTTSYTYECGSAYIAQTSLPDTSSPNLTHHTTTLKHDCNTGLVMSTTDQNGQPTSFAYDSMLRPTQVNLPDGGQDSFSYPTATQTVEQDTIDGSRSNYSTVLLDGYGRLSRMAIANGEASPTAPYDQQDFCYGSTGQLSFQSYPYQGNGFDNTAKVCSGAGDSFSYDPLGRSVQVTHSDGAALQYSYNGRAMKVTDEGNGSFNASRILQMDGIGRLTKVCEVSSASLLGSAGIPVDCGLDIAGTGFLTSFNFNTLNDLSQQRTIVQPGVNTRTYVYDSLNRLTAETEPEWGSTTTYSYDNNSLLHQRVRPAANQTDVTKTVTTTYAYDELLRPTSISYSDGSPSVQNTYDESSVQGINLSNTIGRLTHSYFSATPSLDRIFSYDSRGHIVYDNNSPPGLGGRASTYTYDLVGDMTGMTGVLPTTFQYSYNLASRLTGITSTATDGAHPGTLLRNAQYGPQGVKSFTYGNGIVENINYSPWGAIQSQNDLGAMLGSATINLGGSERSTQVLTQPAAPGTGSLQISGALQWKPVASSTSTGGTSSISITGAPQQNPAGTTPGTATIAFSGTEQQKQVLVQPATPSQGTVTINGSLQSTQVQTQPGTPASLPVSLGGSDSTNSTVICTIGPLGRQTCHTINFKDTGKIQFTINAAGTTIGPVSVNYNGSSTPATLAAGLFSAFPANSVVTMSNPNGAASFTLTTVAVGSASNNATFSATLTSNCLDSDTTACGGVGWTMAPTLANFSGGQNAIFATLYDSGLCTIAVANHTDQLSWSGSGTTAAGIASGLANAISVDSSAPVKAALSGTTVLLTTIATGRASGYSLSSSCSFDSGHFGSPSFVATSSGSTLSNGQDAIYQTVYDSGHFSLTVNGHTVTPAIVWGAEDIATNLAFDLANKINADTGSPVTASASDTTVTLTAKAKGSISNYAFNVSGDYDNTDFSQPSFAATASGATLTGGAPNANAVDSGIMTVALNGQQYSYKWGASDTQASIASGLVSQMINNPAFTVTSATSTDLVSGKPAYSVYVTPKSIGTAYSLSSATTWDSQDFQQPSFPVDNAIADFGNIQLVVNGHPDTFWWSGPASSPSTLIAGLVANIANDAGAPESAQPDDAVNGEGLLVSKLAGANTNYSLAATVTSDTADFPAPSYAATPSGPSLIGGHDNIYTTVLDTGNFGISFASVNYNNSIPYGPNDSPNTLAATLAGRLHDDPASPVDASASTNVLTLTARDGGTGGNLGFAISSATNNSLFTGSSFNANPAVSSLVGGSDGTGSTLYSYSLTPAPDRNIASMTDSVNGNWSYAYDAFNRLASSNRNNGQQTFSYDYDPSGNRWHQNAPQGGPAPQYTFDANNHITGSGMVYDALGNITSMSDGITTHNYTYDDENRLVAVDGGATASYVYDTAGRRVQGPQGKYLYDLDDNVIAIITPTGALNGEIYGSGKHLGTYSGGTTNFLHTDWLGSKRVMTGVNGAVSQTCSNLPFGDGANCSGTNWSLNDFTGFLHDPETGLEHAWFRKYSGIQGRWTTPDLTLDSMNVMNPQSLNRYAYVENNPLINLDPQGLRLVRIDLDDGTSFLVDSDDLVALGFTFEFGDDGRIKVWSAPADFNIALVDANGNRVATLTPNTDYSISVVTDSQTVTVSANGSTSDVASVLVIAQVVYSDGSSESNHEAAVAIYNSFSNFPNICSLTFGATATLPTQTPIQSSFGVQYNTDTGFGVRNRMQLDPAGGYFVARATSVNGGKPKLSFRAGGNLGLTMGISGPHGEFLGHNITSIGASYRLAPGVSVGVSGQVARFYACPH